MGAGIHQKGRPLAAINVTPFVDVVLVLLVVLMVTAVQIVRGSIQVDLPTAASAGQVVDSTLNIVISADGQLFLDGNPATEQELRSFVQAEIKKNPKLQAVIAADKSVVYESVVRVIDVVKSNGVKRFALNIERPKP